MTEKNGKLIVTAVDCTGHGVPGAFMSMLGVAYLNEIVNKIDELNASELMNQLREYVIHSLRQKETEGETKDGMDMALCIINTKQQLLQFAGANNPLYLLREGKILETKGDKMPIGIHARDSQSFTNHTINLIPGDAIYLFSDGYADQFGGAEGKKFKYKPFKDLLINTCHLPMEEQKNVLDEMFITWKGDLPQVDDVVVIGIKL
jgi:serine phosphatase RsbU (regulator of sigma subunit)